jgi:hypothetical protein
VGICVRRVATLALCAVTAAGAVACSSGSKGSGEPEDSGEVADAAPEASSDATLGDLSPPTDATVEGAATDAGDGASDSAVDGGVTGCALDNASESTELRCTGLYADWPTRTIAPGVVEYDPGLHLWSDGAVKTRWVYLPPGTTINTSNMDEWTFPNGTRFWKQFVVDGVLIETRMLHKAPAFADAGPYVGTWYLTTYQWSADGTSTSELLVGQMNVNDAGYEIPSQAKCSTCHLGRRDDVLGFEAVSLSSPDAGGLPMSALVAQGLLTDPPDAALTIPGDPTQAAALGYLHANCGVPCHNTGGGEANSTGFHMRLLAAELGSVQATDTYTTGWGQPTAGFHIPGDPTTIRLAACDAPQSCVYYRMDHRDPFSDAGFDTLQTPTQMPPIDTHLIDPTGLATVAAWLNEGCDASVPLDASFGSPDAGEAGSADAAPEQ